MMTPSSIAAVIRQRRCGEINFNCQKTLPHNSQQYWFVDIAPVFLCFFQTSVCSYPVHVWYDGPAEKLRMDVYDGMDSVYITPVSDGIKFDYAQQLVVLHTI